MSSLSTHIFTPAPEALAAQGEALRALLGTAVTGARVEKGELVLLVASADIEKCANRLKANGYQQLIDITAVDDPSQVQRFTVVYNFLSLTENRRVRLHCALAEGASIPTLCTVYPAANWFEREVFDMYGIRFEGHPDLRRILTDYGFEGFPQRKDFPLTGYTELRYDNEQRRIVSEPVKLVQDYRAFDFESPWEGIIDVQLPGDEKVMNEKGEVVGVKPVEKKHAPLMPGREVNPREVHPTVDVRKHK